MSTDIVFSAIESFNNLIDRIEARCLAVDGPVTPTLQEMREDELSSIWQHLQTIRASLSPAATPVSEAGGEAVAGWCQPNGITKQAEYDIDRAIGGTYELPDGRSFWLDHAAVKEIMRRAVPVIAAECERHRLVGGRTAKPAKAGGC